MDSSTIRVIGVVGVPEDSDVVRALSGLRKSSTQADSQDNQNKGQAAEMGAVGRKGR